MGKSRLDILSLVCTALVLFLLEAICVEKKQIILYIILFQNHDQKVRKLAKS